MDNKLADLYQEITKSEFTDSLTGLVNHGFFQLTFDREIKRAIRHGEPFTFGLVDVDSFSRCNEKYGHAEADRILIKVAELVKTSIRDTDLASRFSGDVFALLLVDTEASMAHVVGERIRSAVENHFGGDLSVSVGLTSIPRDGTNRREIMKNAAKALLQAKMDGKNKVYFFEQEEDIKGRENPRVLVVDDDKRNVKLMETLLKQQDFQVAKAYSGEDALSLVEKAEVDLILLDIMMPGIDGFEVCRKLKTANETRLIPIIMLTALDNHEAKVKAIKNGADDFITKPPDREELIARTRSLINMRRLNRSLTSIENVLFSLATAVEAKDSYTEGHTKRVSDLSMQLGKKLKLHNQDLEALLYGGVLHDVGKIGVPSSILNKAGPLDQDEWEIMKNHTDIGYRICLPLKDLLGPALDIVRHHHEKLCGSGYPDGLKGEKITMPARIMAVVDIFDALTTDRPYRKAMSISDAIDVLRKEAGEGKLDEIVVEALVELVGRGVMQEEEIPDTRSGTEDKAQNTILIIEDNELNMKLVRSLLKFEKYKTLEAETAENGIEMARVHNPDLILMDIQLPGMDGLSAVKIIKEDDNLKHIPVVALTSYAMQGDEEKAIKAGCSGYIAKPIETKSFTSIISQYLN
jgi:putative two-component system response regulator